MIRVTVSRKLGCWWVAKRGSSAASCCIPLMVMDQVTDMDNDAWQGEMLAPPLLAKRPHSLIGASSKSELESVLSGIAIHVFLQ